MKNYNVNSSEIKLNLSFSLKATVCHTKSYFYFVKQYFLVNWILVFLLSISLKSGPYLKTMYIREAFKKKINCVEIFHTSFTPPPRCGKYLTIKNILEIIFWAFLTILRIFSFFPPKIPKNLEKFQCILAGWVGEGGMVKKQHWLKWLKMT